MNDYPSIANVPTSATRIVKMARGSWKYQDRYQISTYSMRRTKNGKWIWESDGFVKQGQGVGFALNKSNRERVKGIKLGSLHNQPVFA